MNDKPIISVLNPKGGVGMITIATNLAGAMAERGLDVLLVDSDEEGLSTDWARARDSVLTDVPAIVSLPALMQLHQIAQIRSQFDVVIVDGVARKSELASAVIKGVDLIILQVRPTSLDGMSWGWSIWSKRFRRSNNVFKCSMAESRSYDVHHAARRNGGGGSVDVLLMP